MEYVPGTNLRTYIQNRSLTPDDAVAVMRQLLSALSHAHSHHVVHRDIKPENILIHERVKKEGFGAAGAVKVTDFGLGKAAANSHAEIMMSTSLEAPEAKKIAGTLDYMAPEARGGADLDGRADLYACGVVLYEMLTGEKPAGTEVPSDLNPKSPRHLDDVFRRSYARLEKRFASADEFLEALDSPITLVPAEPPPLPTQPSGRTCPNCQRPVAPNDQFCLHCGVQLVEWVLRCPQCGSYPDPNDRFCMFCGVALGPRGVA